MSTEEKLQYWEVYCRILFEKFNGWINPIIPAVDITFDYYLIRPNEMNLGRCVMNEINVNLVSVCDYCLHMEYFKESQVQGFLAYIVMHELSHCDQKIDYCDNIKFILQEIANDQRVSKFAYENRDKITSLIGNLDQSFFDILIKRIDGHPLVPYIQVGSFVEKYVDFIAPFVDKDYRGFMYTIKNIIMRFYMLNGMETDIVAKYDGEWVDLHDNSERFKYFLRRPHFNYSSTSILDLNQNILTVDIKVTHM